MQDISGCRSSSLLQFSLSCWLCKDPSVAPQNIFFVVFVPWTWCGAGRGDQPGEETARTGTGVFFPLGGLNSRESAVGRNMRGWEACVRPPLLLLPPVTELTHFKLGRRTTPSSEQTGGCTTQTRGKGAVWRDNGTGRRHPYALLCQGSFCTLLDLVFFMFIPRVKSRKVPYKL